MAGSTVRRIAVVLAAAALVVAAAGAIRLASANVKRVTVRGRELAIFRPHPPLDGDLLEAARQVNEMTFTPPGVSAPAEWWTLVLIPDRADPLAVQKAIREATAKDLRMSGCMIYLPEKRALIVCDEPDDIERHYEMARALERGARK